MLLPPSPVAENRADFFHETGPEPDLLPEDGPVGVEQHQFPLSMVRFGWV